MGAVRIFWINTLTWFFFWHVFFLNKERHTKGLKITGVDQFFEGSKNQRKSGKSLKSQWFKRPTSKAIWFEVFKVGNLIIAKVWLFHQRKTSRCLQGFFSPISTYYTHWNRWSWSMFQKSSESSPKENRSTSRFSCFRRFFSSFFIGFHGRALEFHLASRNEGIQSARVNWEDLDLFIRWFFTFYHGHIHHHEKQPTIWENIWLDIFQASANG